MIWNILIITRNYDKYVELFHRNAQLIETWKSSNIITEIQAGFVHIVIIKYTSSFSQFRGFRAHLVYLDDDLIQNEDLKTIILPCATQGNKGLLPVSNLHF